MEIKGINVVMEVSVKRKGMTVGAISVWVWRYVQ